MLFFLLYIVSVLLLGSFFVGSLSVRVYVVLLMMVVLTWSLFIKHRRFNVKNHHSYMVWFLIFIVVSIFALLASGELESYNFTKRIFAYYLVGIVSFYSIAYYVRTEISLKILVSLLSIVLLVDSVITIMQYNGNVIAWAVGQLFSDISSQQERAISQEYILGKSIIPGLFGSVVQNAYAIAVLSPMPFVAAFLIKKKYVKVIAILCYAIALYASFATQQRTAFGLTIVAFLFVVFISLRKSPVTWVVLLLIVMVMGSTLVTYIVNVDYGRLIDIEDADRQNLTKRALEFISDHWLFGGPSSFERYAGKSAHNLFLDSFICSGILGFLFMSLLYLKSIAKTIKNIFQFIFKKSNTITALISLSLLISLIYGLFHNISFLTGDTLVFIMLALMLNSELLETKKIL